LCWAVVCPLFASSPLFFLSLFLHHFISPNSPLMYLHGENWTDTGQFSLALTEIYVCLARVFGEFEFSLFETTKEDVEQVHDFFSPFPRTSRGVRVVVE
jgi:hypothetical protein